MATYRLRFQHYIRIICFALVAIESHGQNSVQIQVTPVIRLGQDDLRITCSATGSYDAITSYTLVKNETNGLVSTVVQQLYSLFTSSVRTTWTDTNLQSRANLSGVALPSPTATMVLTVLRDRVKCPDDAVGYRCDFAVIPTAGGAMPQTMSDFQYVQITTPPSGVQQINVQAELNGQQVPTSAINGSHVFVVGTVLTLSCTAEVGSGMQTQLWCHKKSNDFAWDFPAFGVSHGVVTPGVNCQYSRVSTYVHNVTSNDDSRVFICEIGGAPQCGFGDFSSNITIHLTFLPVIVTPADSYSRNAGESVTLNCSVSSANPVVTQIQWIRTSNSQTTTLTINGIKDSGATVSNPSLTIHRLQITDAGQYQCQAINTVGTGSGLPISLNVTGIYTTPTCDPITGGRTERCLVLSTYNDYQYAYCITDGEVRTRTNNTQQCSDGCRNYCLLTCMVEKYGVYNGSVTDECRCYPTETTDSVTQIPSWCLNPQGQSNFYEECVPARFRSCQNVTEMQADLKSEIMQLSKTFEDEKNCTMKTLYRNYRRCVQIVVIDELTSNNSCDGVKPTVEARINNTQTTTPLSTGDGTTPSCTANRQDISMASIIIMYSAFLLIKMTLTICCISL